MSERGLKVWGGGEGGLTATKFFKGEGKVRKADLIIILKRVGLVVEGGPLFKGGAETPLRAMVIKYCFCH